MRKNVVLVCGAALALLCAGCRKEKPIEFDESEPLSLAPDVSWAVVREPYAALREAAGWDSETAGSCLKAEIFQIIGKSVSSDGAVWYELAGGWLPADAVSVYNNRFRAGTAAAALRQTVPPADGFISSK